MWVSHSLRDLALPLGQLPRPPAPELEHGVQPVHEHPRKPEERGGTKGATVAGLQVKLLCWYKYWMGCPSTYLNYSCQSCRKIEEGPESAEPKLNHEPGNDVEFFHGVNEVHYQEHEAHPKGGHRDKNKPLSYCPLLVVRARAHHTDKTQNIYQLKWRWED